MPFDAQNYEYLKNDFHLKRELVADSRDKIIRHSHIKNKFNTLRNGLVLNKGLFFIKNYI